ncbi:MAG: class I SAM-dependent methyltransferase [Planctomycetota bacterium]|jgi:cyclopropane fatty-acyl-phospholipid synthase-like methyltransferase
MNDVREIRCPEGFDWQAWADRWDKMQQRYIVRRAERFEVMARLIRETQDSIVRIVDLGCGTGSLMLKMLEAFPNVELTGIDFDPTLIPLAQNRLTKFSGKVTLFLDDLRQDEWLKHLSGPVDAVVSATALHWLKPKELAELYVNIAKILRVGGIFLNADHVSSENKQIQEGWEKHREKMLNQQKEAVGEKWEVFWTDYMAALGLQAHQINQRVLNKWESGVEEGMPLSWHFERLKAAGFTNIDCFWRCDCDAIYGGIVSNRKD